MKTVQILFRTACGMLCLAVFSTCRRAESTIRLPDHMMFARIPAGDIVMGSREGAGDVAPHRERVEPFYLATCEITVMQFARYLDGWKREDLGDGAQCELRAGRIQPRRGLENFPVSGVTLDDARDFAKWLSDRTGRILRLPTEIEWEYAARGGIRRAPYPWGWGDPASRANFNSQGPKPVGQYAPNPFGLYDMAGNVFEWCDDPANAERNGSRPVARGGGWSERSPEYLRVFHRTSFPADYRNQDVGFRLLLQLSQQE